MQKGEKERRGSKEARPGRVRHSARIHGPENGWGARGSERERERGERERESERAGGGRPCRARGRERRVGVEEEEEEEEENKRTDRARKSRILQ